VNKPDFLVELHELRHIRLGPWMLIGDFNLIYRAKDKNNTRLNRRLMGQFWRFLNKANLQEVHLNGRLFTWSNERAHPTLERIYQVFVSNAWDALYLTCELHSLVSSYSDHAPLLLCTKSVHHVKKWFHFCSFWTCLPGFWEVVQQAWHYLLGNVSLFCKLDWLFCNTVCFLTSWSSRFMGNIRSQLEVAKEVVHQ
jgi:hypothetical protein